MAYPNIVFRIRVTDDEKHAIYCQDFDAFEEYIIFFGLEHLNEELDFSIVFREVPEGEDEEIPF